MPLYNPKLSGSHRQHVITMSMDIEDRDVPGRYLEQQNKGSGHGDKGQQHEGPIYTKKDTSGEKQCIVFFKTEPLL
jgi:hypothetical protein